ncbi:MAG: methyltransferase domain-containing protein [Hyphomicrobiaceae bacterium]
MTQAPHIFDRPLLTRHRDRAAAVASGHDFLLARVAHDFAERLAIVNRTFSAGLNLDSHHGLLSRSLRPLPNVGALCDADLSTNMLAQCDGPTLIADAESLDLAPGSLDLLVSGLSLHLVNDLPGALIQIRRALKPDGLFLSALLGGDTLRELREAWFLAEEQLTGGVTPRVAPFADVRAMGGLLQRAGFALPVADTDTVTVTYQTPLHLMRELKGMGASNMLAQRSRRPVTRKLLMRAADIYAERSGLADGRIKATFEIITLTAWVPHESQQKPLKPGSATTRLADALKPKPRT